MAAVEDVGPRLGGVGEGGRMSVQQTDDAATAAATQRDGTGTRGRPQVIGRECARPGCGTTFTPAARGPAQTYCSPSCRQQAYAIRRARAAIDTGHADPPTILRETVHAPCPPQPTARQWLALLATLTEQLADPTTPLARQHWHHPKLLTALHHTAAALHTAYPGPLHPATRTAGGGRDGGHQPVQSVPPS